MSLECSVMAMTQAEKCSNGMIKVGARLDQIEE